MALEAPTDGPLGDSALLIDDGEVRVLNMNDSRPTDPDKLLACGPLDLLFLQFSGAIWYPMVYEFPAKAQQSLGHKKRVVQLGAGASATSRSSTRRSWCRAPGRRASSTTTCSSRTTSTATSANIFPDQTDFLDHLAEHGSRRRPADAARAASRDARQRAGSTSPTRCRRRGPPIFDDKRAYLRGVPGAEAAAHRPPSARAGRRPTRVDLLAELKAWLEPLMGLADRSAPGSAQPVLLDLGDEGIVLDFVDQKVRRPLDGRGARATVFRIDRELVDCSSASTRWTGSTRCSCRCASAPRRQGPVQRLPLHLVQVPRPRAAPVRRGLLRRERADRGHVRSSTAGRSSGAART